MQCANCRFENMPGVDACGRCGGSLRLATAAIDVHPPRAGMWARRWRRLPGQSAPRRLRTNAAAGWAALWVAGMAEVPAGPVLWRMVLPGWPQLHLGRRFLGRSLMLGWLACAALAVLFVGSSFGSVCLGAAITCHTATVIDVVNTSVNERRRRIGLSLLLISAVGLSIYYPATQALGRWVSPRVIARDTPPFQEGDVLLMTPSRPAARYSAGDIVVYRPPPMTLAAHQGLAVRVDGERVDRILGTGLQTVVWENRALCIDGIPVPWKPLNPHRVAGRMELVVPQGHYLILPSSLDPRVQLSSGDQWRALCVVPASTVLGRVWWQQLPLSKMGPLE